MAVVEHHCGLPNLGDMTAIKEVDVEHYGSVGLLAGGTPCQSFSVAGLRGGLADPRGNLALRFLQLAGFLRPEWVVWENVPGVLSSGGGRDFGSILGGLAQLGYGWAYRILDAQYFGVPQRRRRVFVVGHLGDWRRAASVLFERSCLCGHPAPSREAGADIAASLTRGADSSGKGGYAGRHRDIVNAPDAHMGGGGPDDNGAQAEHYIVAGSLQANGKAAGSATQQDAEAGLLIAHALRADSFDASEDGTGRGTPLVPIGFHCNARAEEQQYLQDQSGPLTAGQK